MMNMKLPFDDILPCGVCEFERIGELFPCRAKERIPEGAKSVIVYLFPYWLGEEYYKNSNVSKYAVPEDYHLIAGEYLNKITEKLKAEYPENKFEYFCDNSPVNEVKAAVLSGLGVKGKNSLLINPDYGSFCFIGEIVTDRAFEYSEESSGECLNCGLCIKKCPSGALTAKGIDIELCLSDVTQRKGELTAENINKIKQSGCIWGCDVCQDVCPMNKKIKPTPVKEFYETAKAFYDSGDNIEKRAFAWRGKKVIERNYNYFKK
ncbi:MAG: epoxyqueuosine reductase [Clostridia bacterium]|nr:epoxyqueuosine reductase [Clostridia bacterium]